jgi:hypothetical protein
MKQKRQPVAHLRLALLLILMTILSTLIGRYLWWLYRVEMRGPMGLMGIFFVLLPAALLIGVLASVCIGLVAWLVSRYRAQGLFPAAILVASLVMIFQLPMPPDPPTAEMTHFLAHRNEYEVLVGLARLGNLSETCPYGNSKGRYEPPLSLEHLSARGCIETAYTPDNTGASWKKPRASLSVAFYPFESYYHSLVYAERNDDPNPCFLDAHVEQKIEAHWYVCEGEWN